MRDLRIVLLLFFIVSYGKANAASLPSGFVYLIDVVPTIVVDIRYATSENFIGTPIDGYINPVAITTRDTALAINQV